MSNDMRSQAKYMRNDSSYQLSALPFQKLKPELCKLSRPSFITTFI
jgi:hypothetical protein